MRALQVFPLPFPVVVSDVGLIVVSDGMIVGGHNCCDLTENCFYE